jgi:spore germination cell wall hydrolase CwlJ-like protein
MIAETCLALAIYWEARNQSTIAKIAVAEVVLHRTMSEIFPNDVCKVIKQGPHIRYSPIRNRCQFSWYCDGKPDTPDDIYSWRESLRIAKIMLKVYPYTFTDLPRDTYYFHSVHKPQKPFFRKKHYVARVGDHLFYAER